MAGNLIGIGHGAIDAGGGYTYLACIRRVAGCATPTGSAGHAGATANLKPNIPPGPLSGGRSAYPKILHINLVWPIGPFGRTIAALRADAGTRNKMCHFPP